MFTSNDYKDYLKFSILRLNPIENKEIEDMELNKQFTIRT